MYNSPNIRALDMVFPYVEGHREFDGTTHHIYPQSITRLIGSNNDRAYYVLGYTDLSLPGNPYCITIILRDKYGIFKVPLMDYDRFDDILGNLLDDEHSITGDAINNFFGSTTTISCVKPQLTTTLLGNLNEVPEKRYEPLFMASSNNTPPPPQDLKPVKPFSFKFEMPTRKFETGRNNKIFNEEEIYEDYSGHRYLETEKIRQYLLRENAIPDVRFLPNVNEKVDFCLLTDEEFRKLENKFDTIKRNKVGVVPYTTIGTTSYITNADYGSYIDANRHIGENNSSGTFNVYKDPNGIHPLTNKELEFLKNHYACNLVYKKEEEKEEKQESNSDIEKIAIIKKIDERTGKKVIDKVVIFNKYGEVDIQDYNKIEHLRLINKHLESNNINPQTGIKEAMQRNLITIVNKEDKISMNDLGKEIVEANARKANTNTYENIKRR